MIYIYRIIYIWKNKKIKSMGYRNRSRRGLMEYTTIGYDRYVQYIQYILIWVIYVYIYIYSLMVIIQDI